eukprot:c16950_g1_i1 orf=3-398(-)
MKPWKKENLPDISNSSIKCFISDALCCCCCAHLHSGFVVLHSSPGALHVCPCLPPRKMLSPLDAHAQQGRPVATTELFPSTPKQSSVLLPDSMAAYGEEDVVSLYVVAPTTGPEDLGVSASFESVLNGILDG